MSELDPVSDTTFPVSKNDEVLSSVDSTTEKDTTSGNADDHSTESDGPGALLEQEIVQSEGNTPEDAKNVDDLGEKTNEDDGETALSSKATGISTKAAELPTTKVDPSTVEQPETEKLPHTQSDPENITSLMSENNQKTTLVTATPLEKEEENEEQAPAHKDSPSVPKTSNVSVTAQSQSLERPVEPSFLVTTLEKAPQNPEDVVPYVLEKVQAKSSKYKYIVLVTEFDLDSESQVNSLATFGAVWESSKDGFVSLERELLRKILQVTLYWVYIS